MSSLILNSRNWYFPCAQQAGRPFLGGDLLFELSLITSP